MKPPSDRVRNYHGRRHIWERLQALTTTSGWPHRLASFITRNVHLDIERHTVKLPTGDAPPLRIAFASDFHAGPTTRPDVLERSYALLTELKPDVLLLGGDFVCLYAHYVDEVAERIGEIPAPLGKYAVLGNHDLWTDYHHIERRLETAGVELLTNRNVRLPAPFESTWLCGLDDHWSGRPDADAAFEGADGVRVVVMHQPSGLVDIGNHRFDLAFCGHTHGGQIALPGGYPLVVPEGPLSRTYVRGRYDLAAQSTLIFSRGVGCSTVPFRAFATPDIILCILESSGVT